jgi:hypothetical protein
MSEAREYIPVIQLCNHYKVEITLFNEMQNIGLIEITTYKEQLCIPEERLGDLEKMIRIHRDLQVNLEGIDVVFNLLQKVDELKNELNIYKNKLRLKEGL